MNTAGDSNRARASSPRGEIAIVGMACLFPGAPDLTTYWRNIASGVDAVGEPPPGRWDADPFYDPASTDDDRLYTQRGGYLPTTIPFDPLRFGIMPVAVAGGEVDQFLVLKLVYDALTDAGYPEGLPEHERTEFVLGRGNYLGPGNSNLFQRSIGIEQALRVLKAVHPKHSDEELAAIRRELRASLPPFGPELGPTHIPNVVTGRTANRLDLMGGNFTVDAACASSLIAVETAMNDLLSGKCDIALAGGSHTFTCVPLLMVFCTLNALSRSAEIRPFAQDADGTLPGEGVGVVVLKRREDAERAGDRIYAVIKGVGSASDGRALSVMAPRLDGEVLALRRAYEHAGVDPRTVGLIEGHGTATTVGDATEVTALDTVFGPRDGEVPTVALGTVKSMIGHAMPASGIAGIIKTALALHHKILPPTLHCAAPNEKLDPADSAVYINTQTRPWINAGTRAPRRAGVNSFGFGGINAHVVMEEYTAAGAPAGVAASGPSAADTPDLLPWDSELVLLGATTRQGLVEEIERLRGYLTARPEVELADLSYTYSRRFGRPAARLALIASSRDDLDRKLARAHKMLSDASCAQIKDPRGIYYFSDPLAARGKIAFLFPGEGSQHVNMLAQLCLHFPEVRAVFDAADRDILAQGRGDLLSSDVFPPPFRTPEDKARVEQRLSRIDRQCEAIMAANRAMFTLFSALGLQPDMMVGHSIGEWSSLTAGGIADPDPPIKIRRSLDAMATAIDTDPTIPRASLLAIAADRATAEAVIEGIADAFVAVDNCPHQVVLAAGEAAADQVIARLKERGIGFERSRFDRGSHTPLFAGFTKVARRHFKAVEISAPRVEVYSCCTAAPLPHDPEQIRSLVVRSWEQPVEYRRTIEAMYEAGARIFIETGPRNVLSAFTDDILRGKSALVLAVDLPKWTELTGLNHLVGMLTAQGLDLAVPYLFERRARRELTLDAEQDAPRPLFDGRPAVMLSLAVPMMSLGDDALATLRAGSAAGDTEPTHPAEAITPKDTSAETIEPSHTPPGGEPLVLEPALAAASRTTSVETPPVAEPGMIERQPVAARLSAERAVAPAGTATPPHALPAAPGSVATIQPPLAAGRGPLAGDGVLAHYMQTMQGFLQAEQRVLHTLTRPHAEAVTPPATVSTGPAYPQAPAVYPARRRTRMVGRRGAVPFAGQTQPPLPTGPDNRDGPLPLLGEVLSHLPGQSLVARRQFTVDEDSYLHSHTFGGLMSTLDPTLEPLTVAPLTISLEMMAEAGAQLAPGLTLTGMEDVRAHRWVQVDESGPTIFEITARRQTGVSGERAAVRVEVREVGKDGAAGAMVIEGTMVYGAAYEPAPQVQPFMPANPCRTFKSAREMYDEMWMFHGPLFQGVTSLDVSGDDGIVGTLAVLPTDTMFRSTHRPRLLTDVALLDAAGQLLGYWAKERLTTSFVVFPIRMAALRIYGPNLPVGTRVRCDVRLTEIMPQTVKVDMDVYDTQGRLWMRIEGWQDWRFHIVGEVYDFWRFPSRTIMSKPVAAPIPATVAANGFMCYRMDKLSELGQTMVTKSLAYMTLNHAERRIYHSLQGPTSRQVEWLSGRIAQKDAVRVYLRHRYGLHVSPGDIEIAADEHGRPVLCGAWLSRLEAPPAISLSHSEGVGIAIVGSSQGIIGAGIDLQRISPRPQEFDLAAFASEERALLDAVDGAARDERRMRFWCAKEAAAKALGRGLVDGPRSVAVEGWHEASGTVWLGLRGTLAAALPHLAQRRIRAYTMRNGDEVIATSFGEAE